MSDFRGTSVEQDVRFGNKQKKLLGTIKFPKEFSTKVNMGRVNKDVVRPWIAQKVTDILGLEDDVLIQLIFNMLDETEPDPRVIQINLTGFLEAKTTDFMTELWQLLLSAQQSPDGIPPKIVEERKQLILGQQKSIDAIVVSMGSGAPKGQARPASPAPLRREEAPERHRRRKGRHSRSRSPRERRRHSRERRPEHRRSEGSSRRRPSTRSRSRSR